MSGVASATLVALGLAGCGGDDGPPNLLVISVDTMRADVMRAYGGDETRFPIPITPAIDVIADEAVIFDRCYTVSPRTTQSMASLMTGLIPSNHGAFGLFHRLEEDVATLAEILSAEGYRTSAVVTNEFLAGDRGFGQGFDTFDDYLISRQQEVAESVVDRVDLLTLEEPSGPQFMWVHFLDPHWPYLPPFELLTMLHPQYDPRRFTLFEDLDSLRVSWGEVIFENALNEDDRKHVRRRYLAEVRYLDGHVKRMVELMRNRGYVTDNTIILFYSDHGESLGEHDYYYAHGEKLYEPTVRVPAFLHYPKELEPGRFTPLVSTPDLLPTVLELMGVEVPADLDGVSQLDALRGGAPPRTVCHIESDYQLIHPENPDFHIDGPRGKWRGVIADRYKLLRIPQPDGDRLELYDLRVDPRETQNLVESEPGLVDQLRPLLAEFDALVDGQEPETVEMDEETARRLRGLGYIN